MALSGTINSSLQSAAEHPVKIISALTFGLTVLWIIYTKFLHPLSGVPGPFLASVTRLWYIVKVRDGQFNELARQLHQQYGPLVRITPDQVSVADPEAVKIIYSTKDEFTKTDFYTAFRSPDIKSKKNPLLEIETVQVNGDETAYPDLFTNLDIKSHAQRRRIVYNLYSMTNTLDSEKYIDSCTELFINRLERFAKSHEEVDMGQWLEMYAFDVMGELFFGEKFGFLETASDVEGFISSMDLLMPVLCTASLLPVGLRTLWMISGLVYPTIRKALPRLARLDTAAKKQVKKRQALLEARNQDSVRRDILDKLFTLHKERGKIDDFEIPDIEQEAYVAIVAGADTTAITLRSILFNLFKHPDKYKKLQEEIDHAAKTGTITFPTRYNDAVKLPYLVACCKEGMRVHPPVGLILPRHVPVGGRQISGYHFEAGCRVGVSPAVLHYNKDIFGADANQFNPDRWLSSNSANMDRYMLQFGTGSRTCLGKNISLAEIHKVLPSLLYRFHFELAHPSRPLITKDHWFNKQWGFTVRVHQR